MTINDYIKQEHDRLDKLARYWKEQHKLQPDLYPLEMQEGDWDEQFIVIEGAYNFKPE